MSYLMQRRDLVDAGVVRRNSRPVRNCKRVWNQRRKDISWARDWKDALHRNLRSIDRAYARLDIECAERIEGRVGKGADAWCWD